MSFLFSKLNLFQILVYLELTLEHYIPPPRYCLLAQTCNHTGISVCGFEVNSKQKRKLFLDICDMYEYNCDYCKAYNEIEERSECDDKIKEPNGKFLETSTVEEHTLKNESTNTSIYSLVTVTGSMNDTVPVADSPTMSTQTITTETNFKTTDTTKVTENNTIIPQSTSVLGSTTELLNTSHYVNFTKMSIVYFYHTPNVTETFTKLTTENKNYPTSATVPNTSPVLINCTRIFHTTVQPNGIEKNYTTINYSTTATLLSSTSMNTTDIQKSEANVDTATMPSNGQTYSSLYPCDTYPKYCGRPNTWETTIAGENRDFFQILKARLGDHIKINNEPQ